MRTPEAHSTRRTLSPARTLFAIGTVPARNAWPAHESDVLAYVPLGALRYDPDMDRALPMRVQECE